MVLISATALAQDAQHNSEPRTSYGQCRAPHFRTGDAAVYRLYDFSKAQLIGPAVACVAGEVQQHRQQSDVQVYFGSKLVAKNGFAVVQDRLGSMRYKTDGTVASYYPYGEDKGTPAANDQMKFATYTRDSATGLDYADQRYYSSGLGRFMTADPYRASGGPSDPGSWNRYSYTRGDPVTRSDPNGLEDQESEGTADSACFFGGLRWPIQFCQTFLQGNNLMLLGPLDSKNGLARERDKARDAIKRDLSLASDALDKPDCVKHFGSSKSRASGWDPQKILSTIYSGAGGYIGGTSVYVGYAVYNFYPLAATAVTGPAVFFGGNTGGVAVGLRVDINASAWNELGSVTDYDIGAQYQAAGLLHEMGHIYDLLSGLGSGGSDIRYDGFPGQGSISDVNQSTILRDCFGIKN